MTYILCSPAEEEKVGRRYSIGKLIDAKLEPDEPELLYTVCDCGERVDFGINSLHSAMCDKGHIWYKTENWERTN